MSSGDLRTLFTALVAPALPVAISTKRPISGTSPKQGEVTLPSRTQNLLDYFVGTLRKTW